MNLALPIGEAEGYVSALQRVRRVTEAWAGREMYCVLCSSPRLELLPNNAKAADLRCPSCLERYQLKAGAARLPARLLDGEYKTMLRAVEGGAPSFLYLQHGDELTRVRALHAIPGFVLGPTCVEPKRPLGPHARRAGWQGCFVRVSDLAPETRIAVVAGEDQTAPECVRAAASALRPVAVPGELGGWLRDVYNLLRSRHGAGFTIAQAYALEPVLSAAYPGNRHVRPKIRQQLQRLRDAGMLRFLGAGSYEWTI